MDRSGIDGASSEPRPRDEGTLNEGASRDGGRSTDGGRIAKGEIVRRSDARLPEPRKSDSLDTRSTNNLPSQDRERQPTLLIRTLVATITALVILVLLLIWILLAKDNPSSKPRNESSPSASAPSGPAPAVSSTFTRGASRSPAPSGTASVSATVNASPTAGSPGGKTTEFTIGFAGITLDGSPKTSNGTNWEVSFSNSSSGIPELTTDNPVVNNGSAKWQIATWPANKQPTFGECRGYADQYSYVRISLTVGDWVCATDGSENVVMHILKIDSIGAVADIAIEPS